MQEFNAVAAKLQNLFGTVADELATKSGFRVRHSKLNGSKFAEAVVGG